MRNSGGRICDDCQMRPATTLSTIELNGNVYDVALCDECFRKRNAANAPVYQAFMQQERECPICHTRLSEVENSQYLGCSECYNVFRSEVLNNIYDLHRTRKHIGKRKKTPRRNKTVGLSDVENMREQYHLAKDEGRFEDAEEILDFLRGADDDKR